ncbi:putative transcription factor WD40-like family [Helianthus annuus]|nr:putative transcription factor WD40-like family [Helianthus annuus]KAJ0441393.1 putative transcription factor WD40-like family [Helianthus annuus]KAJ0459358.1 putative transcription factor WD40-like family [Helianthus annuus]KAJ0643849.1 putative transcription factor WD40-like family [Helianthus annuus]KAJ0820020.1 putative transcription factor WD40-like family [Helianthus annuus]
MVQVPSMLFQGSLLLGLISRATLGYTYVFPLHNIARCWKMYAHGHDYNINSISINSDGETFISADDLRINLWNLEPT